MSDPVDPAQTSDRAWFRSQVDPVVEAEPITDAWAEIESRTAGEPTALPTSTANPSARRWLAVAAAVVLLAGSAVVLAATRGEDASPVTSGRQESTGWYVPTDLPDGWRLTSATVTKGSPCDGASQRWKTLPEAAASDGTRPALELAYSSCESVLDPSGTPGPPLGAGSHASVVGPSPEDPSFEVVRWEDDGLWELTGEGVSRDRLLEAAQAIAAHPGSEDPPLPGFGATGAGANQDADPNGAPSVVLALTSPSGAEVEYQLVVTGEGPRLTPFTSDRDYPLPAQPLALRRRGSIPLEHFSRGGGADRAGYLFGTWPGADVLVPEKANPATNEDSPPTTTEAHALVDALAGSLRPATAEEWRAFVASARTPVEDDRLLTAPTLASIGTSEPATATTTTGGATSTVATTTTSAPPPGATGTISEPGTVRPHEGLPATRNSSLDGLEFRLELPTTTIRAGDPVKGTLLIRNTTDEDIDLSECTHGLTQWGLVPADSPNDPLPTRVLTDCSDTAVLTVPADGSGRYPISSLGENVFAAQTFDNRAELFQLGTLPGGRYLAVVEIPGDDNGVRIELPVTVPDPPCPTSDALAKRYLERTSTEAAARAAADGLGYRVVRIDGKAQTVEQNLTCNRINVDLQGGRVTNVLRG